MTQPTRIPTWKEWMAENRVLFLLVSIIIMQLFVPMLGRFKMFRVLMDIFISTSLICAIYAVSDSRRKVWIAGVLAVPMLITTWIQHLGSAQVLLLARDVFGALFFGYTSFLLLAFIVHQEEINKTLIHGAIAVYFLIGIVWAYLYEIVATVDPGAFYIGNHPLQDNQLSFAYFSFVTLTTLGYGDISPASPIAAYLAILEAIIGQIYIAVIIARLVGIHISQDRRRPDPE